MSQHLQHRLISTIALAAFVLASGAVMTGCKGGALNAQSVDGDEDTIIDDGDTGPIDGGGQTEPPVEEPPPIQPPDGPLAGRSPMRLLTRYEYDNTTSDLLGFATAQSIEFPSENLAEGFENNAWTHNVNPLLLRAYIEAAENLSARVVETPPSALAPCVGASVDTAACMDGLEAFQTRAFRRPLFEDELAITHDLYAATLEASGGEEALRAAVESILQAPQYLYRIELYEESDEQLPPQDGEMTAEDFELVGPYEMASRLSYFLWATTPDQELLDAAAAGDLNTPAKIEEQVTRMLDDPRAQGMVRQFHRQWLGLDGLDSIVKASARFPKWENPMREDMRVSVNAFIDYAYWEEGTLDAFLTSPVVFMTPTLATLYDQPVPADAGGVWKVTYPDEQRAGILTQPGLLGLLAYPDQGSPILRAVFIRERLLCQHLPPPPSDIQIQAPDPKPDATTREVFAELTKEKECAGCHMMINPLGFGFEGYDAVGRWRTVENGKPVDTSGELVSSPDSSINGPFAGAPELATKLAGSKTVEKCLTKKWFTFALGRPADDSDKASLERIQDQCHDSGQRFETLLKAIALSDSFRYRMKKSVAQAQFGDTSQQAQPTDGGQ